jgi:nickel-dependent lactate racemase
MAPPGFTLCTVLNTRKQMTGVFGGDMEAAHLAAVDVVRRADAPVAPEPADWLVLSSGGAPSDVNTIQAIKALINTYHAVRKGGAIIFCAECAEGSPEWLLRATALRDLRELQQRIGTREFRKGHNALWIWELREHAHVIMVSALPQADVDRLGFRAAASLQEAVTLAESLTGAPRLVYSIPHGNLTVPNGGPASR